MLKWGTHSADRPSFSLTSTSAQDLVKTDLSAHLCLPSRPLLLMNNDPDVDAMANAPNLGDPSNDIEMRDTTVVEGGASGGLFLPDDESDGELDQIIQQTAGDIPMDDGGYDTDSYFHDQLMELSEVEEEANGEDSGAEDEDDDDPIIKTYDIYGTKRLAEHLHLLQYPIRPPNRPYHDAERPIGAQIKPRCGHLEIEIPIPDSAYYDHQRGTEWTDEALRKQTIGGTITKGRNYVIGVMHGDELHVTPLKGIVQLRPNFTYIDARDSAEKDVKRSDAMAADRAPRTAKAVQVSAKSTDAVHDLSTTALIRAAEEEKWTSMKWKDADDKESRKLFKLMYTSKTDQICESVTDKQGYLNLLSSTTEEESKVVKPTRTKKEI